MLFRQLVDEKLAQYSYLIGCQKTGEAVVIDPERDVERYLELARREGLRLVAVTETHIHADFLSGVRELAARCPDLRVLLSAEGGEEWRYRWPDADGRRVDYLRGGDQFSIGRIQIRAWHTPGHTPEHLTFVITDTARASETPVGLVSGDFLLVNDLGRPDLLESAVGQTGVMREAAERLHASARGLDVFTDFVQVWPGHGAGSACGKALGAVPISTVGYERQASPALANVARGLDVFVEDILKDQPEPPLYFADMKRLNRDGPPLLLATRTPPPRISADDPRWHDDGLQVIDTRKDRREFLANHVCGSLYAPFDKTFPTIVGSMAERERPVLLIADESAIESAMIDLARIGVDNLVAWSTPEHLFAKGGTERRGQLALASLESIDVEEFERRRHHDALAVLDVRSAAEYTDRHFPGAQNIAHTRLRAHLGELDRNRVYYVHCGSGARAATAVALLARHGFTAVHVDGAFAKGTPREPTTT